MRVFVTGGTGFIGSHLVARLIEQDHEVRCLVRNRRKAEELFGNQMPELIPGNLENTEALAAGCSGAEAIFHLAGVTAARSEAEFYRTNSEATRRLTQAATHGSTLRSFIYVSSLAAAGPAERGQPISNPEAADPVTNYGRSKLAGEDAVRRSGLPWIIIRPPAVYGPRDTEFLRVFKFSKLGIAPLFGDGSQELSLIFANDLVEALIAAALKGTKEKTYYAAHRDVVTSQKFVELVYREVKQKGAGARPFLIKIPSLAVRAALQVTGTAANLLGAATVLSSDRAGEFLAPAWTCDPTELERDTGWRARHNTRQGISHTATWYRENGWL
ncbi:MAG: NAD-dependent epimerase/dehydratase family protein [Gemmatimonadales bacterium]